MTNTQCRPVRPQAVFLILGTLSLGGLPACGPAQPSETADDWPLQVLASHPQNPTAAGQVTTGQIATGQVATGQVADLEPNDTFENAQAAPGFNDLTITGTIHAGADIIDQDVYELGPASAGDHLTVALTVTSGSGVALGVLDENRSLIAYANPSNSITGPRTIDITVERTTDRLYLLVAGMTSSNLSRTYTIRHVLEPGGGTSSFHPQVVVLNFDGAPGVRVGSKPAVDVPVFDASRISSRFAGKSVDLANLVLDMVREDYDGLDIEVYLAGDPTIPASGYSIVHFGTYNAQLLGLADNIDPFNADLEQTAIIFTDTFALFEVLSPSVLDMAQVLANVASHEAGHLLGLRHTRDVHDIMDITASAYQMLLDQWFRTAALHETVLPLGFQDAPSLLAWTLGGSLNSPPADKMVTLYRRTAEVRHPHDFYIPRWQLAAGACPGDTTLAPGE